MQINIRKYLKKKFDMIGAIFWKVPEIIFLDCNLIEINLITFSTSYIHVKLKLRWLSAFSDLERSIKPD